jgi:hypothetical protein
MTRMDFHRLSPEIATKAVMFNDMIHCAHRDRPIPNDLDMTHETFLQELCMTCSFAFSVLMFIRSMPCKLSKFTCLTIHATCCHHQTCMYGFCNVITANIPAARLFPASTTRAANRKPQTLHRCFAILSKSSCGHGSAAIRLQCTNCS